MAIRPAEKVEKGSLSQQHWPLPLAPLVRRLPLPSQRRLRRAEAYLDTLIYQLIDAHRVQGGEKGDVLTILLDARTEDGRPLSPRQIHDEA